MPNINKKMLIPTVLCITTVFILTHVPPNRLPWSTNNALTQAIQHILAYGLITILVVSLMPKPRTFKLLLAALLIVACIAVVDELTQSYFNRQATLIDFGSDLVGIAAALCISRILP